MRRTNGWTTSAGTVLTTDWGTDTEWFAGTGSSCNTVTFSTDSAAVTNCRFTVTNGTSGGTGIQITNDHADWYVTTGTTWNWVTETKPEPKWHESYEKNHRGILIRSAHKERQFEGVTQSEMLALQLLRGMVSQEEFRRYLRYGHIHVRGDSGLVYQIGRHDRIQVWERGVKIAALCVHLKHEHRTPPTDEVVGKLLIIECDEPDIWTRSNVSWLTDRQHAIAGDKALKKSSSGIYIANGGENVLNELLQATA